MVGSSRNSVVGEWSSAAASSHLHALAERELARRLVDVRSPSLEQLGEPGERRVEAIARHRRNDRAIERIVSDGGRSQISGDFWPITSVIFWSSAASR